MFRHEHTKTESRTGKKNNRNHAVLKPSLKPPNIATIMAKISRGLCDGFFRLNASPIPTKAVFKI